MRKDEVWGSDMKNNNFFAVFKDDKMLILLFTIASCLLLAFLVNFVMGIQTIYTQLFYIPILLAGIWYQKEAVYVAIFIGALHLIATYGTLGQFVTGTFERYAIFVVVAYVIGYVSNKYAKGKQEIAETRDKLQKILSTISDTICVFDRDLNVLEANRARLKIFGAEKEDVVGKKCHEVFGNREEICEVVLSTLESGKESRMGKAFELADGTKKYLDIIFAPIHDEKGDVVQVLCDMRDLTEYKAMEEKLLRTERLAVLGEFSSGIAHELRQPLAVISNSVYFLGRKLKDVAIEKVPRHLEILEKEVKHANRMISDLLEFARVPLPTLKQCRINQAVEDALSSVEIPKNIEVKTMLKEDLPVIQADLDKIKSACVNIISNAVSAMPEGGKLAIKTGNNEEGKIEISIADTGAGIPKENLQEIFNPLFTTKARGFGLGLSLCKKYVEAHGGEIGVESEVGKGSTFTIKLPISGQGKGS